MGEPSPSDVNGATLGGAAVSAAPGWLPGQLDLEFGAIVLDLELHL